MARPYHRALDPNAGVQPEDDYETSDASGAVELGVSPTTRSALSAQRAGERQQALFPHIVSDPDTGQRYRVFAPSGVSASEIMRLAPEQIGRIGNEKAQGIRAELVDAQPGQPQREQLTGAQRVVRQSAAPIVGGTLGAVAGAVAAPFTAGVINPWTGAMIGSAAGEAFNQYAPVWNEFTQSPKDDAAIALTGLTGAIPAVGRATARAAAPAAQAAGNLMGKVPGYLGAVGGGLLDLVGVLGGGVGALSGLAAQHAPRLLAKALTSSAGRAALNAAASTSPKAQAIGQTVVQTGRTATVGTATSELERQRMRGRR